MLSPVGKRELAYCQSAEASAVLSDVIVSAFIVQFAVSLFLERSDSASGLRRLSWPLFGRGNQEF